MINPAIKERQQQIGALIAACLLTSVASAATIYIQEGAPDGGNGSKARPLNSLAEAQARSRPGDTLYVVPGKNGAALAGGLVLKTKQKLIGLDEHGHRVKRGAEPVARIRGSPARALVEVAPKTEVADIFFDVDVTPALVASATPHTDPFSGVHIYRNVFSGQASERQASEQGEVIYSVDLDALTGSVRRVRMNDNVFRDGGSLGGIRVTQRGRSKGEYRFERNRFFNLGARAYYVLTTEDSTAATVIGDSVADNIGRGNRNSDSILPYLMGRSSQTMQVRRYHYSNTAQVGNASNTGLELWVFGGRGDDRSTWCVACKVQLDIEDSVFDGAVTDGIQLTNFGSNTVMDIRIRRTKVTHATPRQAGGAISLVAENSQSSGSHSTLLIEDSDLSGSGQYAFVVTDGTPGSSAVVDLGGGTLGSRGRNRLSGAKVGAVKTEQASVVARNNWWGDQEPTVITVGDGVTVDIEPRLESDPAP